MFQSHRTPSDFAGTFLVPEIYSDIRTHCQLENGRYIRVHVLHQRIPCINGAWYCARCRRPLTCLRALFDCSPWRQLWRSTLKLGFFWLSLTNSCFSFQKYPSTEAAARVFYDAPGVSWANELPNEHAEGCDDIYRHRMSSLNQFLGQGVFSFHSCCTYLQTSQIPLHPRPGPLGLQSESDSVKVAIVGVLRSFGLRQHLPMLGFLQSCFLFIFFWEHASLRNMEICCREAFWELCIHSR